MNSYKRCLEILGGSNIDYRRLAYKIAAVCPSAIVLAVYGEEDKAKKKQLADLKKECRILLAKHEKIQAIKLWRERTGSSLKDSKEIVEAL